MIMIGSGSVEHHPLSWADSERAGCNAHRCHNARYGRLVLPACLPSKLATPGMLRPLPGAAFDIQHFRVQARLPTRRRKRSTARPGFHHRGKSAAVSGAPLARVPSAPGSGWDAPVPAQTPVLEVAPGTGSVSLCIGAAVHHTNSDQAQACKFAESFRLCRTGLASRLRSRTSNSSRRSGGMPDRLLQKNQVPS
jgi:hypothetical protein